MPNDKKKTAFKQGDFLSYLAARGKPTPKPSLYEQIVAEKYPDVAEVYRPRWDDSDTLLPESEEWKELLDRSVNDLEQAIKTCQRLADNPPAIMTPLTLTRLKNTLLRAAHKAEDVVTELTLSYPTPGKNNYDIAKEDAELSERIPQVLLNTEENILLWTPRFPSKKRGIDSLAYQEFQEMLWRNTFSHFDKWHCAFIHTYHPENALGVLDVDNYRYKPFIDAIARAIISIDAYDYFSCSMYTLPTENLKSGCYILVSKTTQKVENLENSILALLGQKTP